MATTTAAKRGSPPRALGAPASGSAAPTRIGVLWDYPFSLVRRLFLSFVALLALGAFGLWLLSPDVSGVATVIQLVPVALAILSSLYIAELVGITERPLPRLKPEALFAAIGISCIVMSAFYFVTYYTGMKEHTPRPEFLCLAPALAALFVFLQRRWIELRGGDGVAMTAALFAGSREAAAQALDDMAPLGGFDVRTVLLPDSITNREPLRDREIVPASHLERVRSEGVRLFVVGAATEDQLRTFLSPCAGAGLLVEPVADLVAKCEGKAVLDAGNDLRLLARLTTQAKPYAIQRATDILIAGIALLLSLPAWPLVALLVKLGSRGPVLFRQERVGLWGRTFTILKFRTMRIDAEDDSGPVWSQPGDPRVTRIGRLLRTTRLDELPQLLNVIKGDMSLVGPRPERPYFVKTLNERVQLYAARNSVRPGVTGWAQIRYPYGATEEDSRAKLAYDIFYILNRSMTFYFAVLLETGKVILFGRGGR